MNYKILFRNPKANASEVTHAIDAGFCVTDSRTLCKDSIIIGRYSVLPYYNELVKDLKHLNSELINSYNEHLYIANFEWYDDLTNYTFKSYYDYNFSSAPEGEYVVKGVTNSKKGRWNTCMFAANKQEALNIAAELAGDLYIGYQKIVYRKYEKLKTYSIGINGIPITDEFRFFFYKDQLIDYGYYWDIVDIKPVCNTEMIEYAKMIAKIVSQKTNFFVIDVATTDKNEFRVVELNDGQMSGLSYIDSLTFYKNLRKILC